MKVIYFAKEVEKGTYELFFRCFYIPNMNLVLQIEQVNLFGEESYNLRDDKENLREARLIMDNKIPKVAWTTYANIKKFQYSKSQLEVLVESIKAGNNKKIESGIHDIIRHVNVNQAILRKQFKKLQD